MTHTIVLIHGGGASGAEMAPLAELLAPHARVEAIDWLSHGGRELAPLHSYPEIAVDILRQMDQRGIARAVLFGYSIGGTLAMYLARHFPHRVTGLVSLAGKLQHDQDTVDHFVHLCRPERLLRTDPGMATRHLPQDWQQVIDRNREMYRLLVQHPPLCSYDLKVTGKPALVISGEQDQIVLPEETVDMARLLNAWLRLFPGQAHPLSAVPLPLVVKVTLQWLDTVPATP